MTKIARSNFSACFVFKFLSEGKIKMTIMLSKIQLNFGSKYTHKINHKNSVSKPENSRYKSVSDTFIKNDYKIRDISKKREKFIENITATGVLGDDFSNFENVIKDNENLITSYKKDGIPLKYSRKDFLSNLDKILTNSDRKAKNRILKKLNIEPKYNNLTGKITGYDGIIDTSGLDLSKREEKEIYKECNKFLYQNSVNTGNKELDSVLDDLINGMPEFVNVIGKKQHESHSYSVDIHSLTVLSKSINNPDYKDLDKDDKFVLKMTSILHDIGKKEGERDIDHPKTSHRLALQFMKEYNLAPETEKRILNGIKNHQWLQQYNISDRTRDIAEKLVQDYTNENDYKMALIISRADLAATSDHVYELFSDVLDDEPQKAMREAVEAKFNKINSPKDGIKYIHKKLPKTDDEKMSKYLVNAAQILSGEDKNAKNLKHLIDFISENNLPEDILYSLPRDGGINQKLIDNLLSIEKYGKNSIKEFKDDKEALELSHTGDVFKTKNSRFAKIKTDKKTIKELKITPETYLKLFPPVERYMTTQGFSADCFLLSPLNAAFYHPKARYNVLSAFSEAGCGVNVKFPNGQNEIFFKDYKLGENIDKTRLSKGCPGIQMLEYLYGYEAVFDRMQNGKEILSLDKINDTLEDWCPKYKCIEDYYRDHNGQKTSDALYKLGFNNTKKLMLDVPFMYSIFFNALKEGNSDKIIIAAPDTKINLSNGNTLEAHHAYQIKPHKSKNGMDYRVINASNSGAFANITMSEILENFKYAYIVDTKGF